MSSRRKPWETATAFWTVYRIGARVRLIKWVIANARLHGQETRDFRTLDKAREAVPPGLLCIPRLEKDHPSIIEVWL